MSLDEFLKNKSSLANLLISMPVEIRNRCVIKRFPAKSTMIQKDEETKYVYIVISGMLRVVNEFENGKLFGFAYKNPLDFIGMLEVLAEESKMAGTVEAITDCVVLRITKEDFLKWLESDHFFSITIAKEIAKNLYPTAYRIGDVFMNPALYTIVTFIVQSTKKEIKDERIGLITKKRQQIADELGLSLRTVYRVIKKLKEDNLVTIRKGKIHVHKEQHIKLIKMLEEYK